MFLENLGPIIICTTRVRGDGVGLGLPAGDPSGRALCVAVASWSNVRLPPVTREPQVGWAGREGLSGPVPGTRALAEVSQYLICLFATPVGEENCIVPGYLEITANQHDMRGRQKHYTQRKKITQDSIQKDGVEIPLLYLLVLGQSCTHHLDAQQESDRAAMLLTAPEHARNATCPPGGSA